MRPPLSNYGGQPQHAQRKTADNFYRNGNAAKVKNTQQSGQGGMAPVKKALSLAKKFAKVVDAATDTEIPHVALHDLLPGRVYYRFDPVLREYLPLDCADASLMERVREDTQMYLRRNWNRVNEACDQLSLPRPLLKRSRDIVATSYDVASSKFKSDMIS